MVVRRCLARATRVIVAIYKNEEAPIFHRPMTGFSPISNEELPALETALAGRWKSNSLAAGGADPGRRGHLPSMRTPKMSQFRGPVFEMAQQRFHMIADHLEIPDDERNGLILPKRAITMCPIHMDDGRIAAFTGYRVQHHMT